MKPRAVQPGDAIGILAPASPVRTEWLERGEQALRDAGLEPVRATNLLARAEYTAGSPEQRTDDFLELLHDDRIAALFCARGGYGSLDLLPRIAPEVLPDNPKAILGSSDATALLALASQAGIVSFHGPMVAQQIARGDDAWDSEELLAVLGAREAGLQLPWRSAQMLHPGSAEGVLRGGCLSLIASLVGTPFQVSFEGAIAVLEDIAVKPYQIERMLTQLAMAGLLDGVRGIVFGEMPDCEQHPDQGYTLAELFARLTERFAVPTAMGFATGHTANSPSRTVPFEVRARMDADGLTLLEGAVQ